MTFLDVIPVRIIAPWCKWYHNQDRSTSLSVNSSLRKLDILWIDGYFSQIFNIQLGDSMPHPTLLNASL